jgi:hypothetical protein
MKITYDSTINRYIVAHGVKVMSFSPRQFETFKTLKELVSQFHVRIIDDEEVCYNEYGKLDDCPKDEEE